MPLRPPRLLAACLTLLALGGFAHADDAKPVRVGIIGLDTSHAPAFAKILNDPKAAKDVSGFRVVAAYPKGSPDIESSVSRVPKYTEILKEMGVAIVPSIPDLVDQVDVVLLETNDGRPHLEQALPVLKAGKPVFIDKPVAASLADTIAIFEAAKRFKTPVFSSSSLRYLQGADAVRTGKYGKVLGADTWSPQSMDPTHPDLLWYGIHGVEPLFTMMGTGCKTVRRFVNKDQDVVVGTWTDGRLGVFRGLKQGARGYGAVAFTEKKILPLSRFDGYRPLMVEIVKMWRSGEVPVPAEETIEIIAFCEAADISKEKKGAPVELAPLIKKARAEASSRLAALLDEKDGAKVAAGTAARN
ncbi:Oxidoreductase family, NAD-binding Rossmann fold [Planctomycetes bacterium Pan216]|uniref:Oxidoreductase family, NAD-binding Rossmann fold n=1 Tax=Kolteria novifilia TaxID=2527975 RepID=A0A518AZH1_9BACT|nr:Oxidoreductase family, NAD-binding Rossmann fold [Planctomycetes bacterium Pan216]